MRQYYAGKQGISGDTGSVKSGLVSHNRNDSISGSIGAVAGGSAGGVTSSPLASPREVPSSGRLSRTNSGWGDSLESSGELDKTEGEKAKVEDGKAEPVAKADDAAKAGDTAKIERC